MGKTKIKTKNKSAGTVQSSALQAHVDEGVFRRAIEQHNLGVGGDSAAVVGAIALLEPLYRQHPGHALIAAYYGSALVLSARDKSGMTEKFRTAAMGMKLLDEAVAASPQDRVVRLLRGRNAYNLPEQYFQRSGTAIEDYTFIVNQHWSGERPLDTEAYAKLVYELGDACARIGRNADAAGWWARLENETSGSQMLPLAQKRLESVANKPAVETVMSEVTNDMIADAARSIGGALVNWAQKEMQKDMKKEQKKNKSGSNKKAKKKK
ncbi:hypothetical protein [Paenibacillus sp. PL2-23]|uniref:hypothetical protein n=1 Tax=Paenibacillus sp. PL2-23 TaxID=2100729 RepID=UPI0030FA1236